jgi:hypothetical protein
VDATVAVFYLATASWACLFTNNTHTKIIRYLAVSAVFWQVVLLALADFVLTLAFETNQTAHYACTALLYRVCFFCMDGLVGITRWVRLAMLGLFFSANLYDVYRTYFEEASETVAYVKATNSTIGSTGISTSVSSTFCTLSLRMIVTVWKDHDFLYSATCSSYLPKLCIDAAGLKDSSASTLSLKLAEREAATEAWKGPILPGSYLVLGSILVYALSLVLAAMKASIVYGLDGRETHSFIALRVFSLVLLALGCFVFFKGNVSWKRLIYTLKSLEGRLWIFYVGVYAAAGLVAPDYSIPVSSRLGVLYAACGFMLWLFLESALRINRSVQATVTISMLVTIVMGIYCTTYVWTANAQLADLNGVGVPGSLTK